MFWVLAVLWRTLSEGPEGCPMIILRLCSGDVVGSVTFFSFSNCSNFEPVFTCC